MIPLKLFQRRYPIVCIRGAQLISQTVTEIFLEVKCGPHWGSGAVPQWGPGAKPLVMGSDGRSPPVAEDDLLIQQQTFCAHGYVCAEIQL